MEKKETNLESDLQKLSNDSDSMILSFIAPETIVKTSPNRFDYTSISINDLYNIENKIEEIKQKFDYIPEKLQLVIHTPGGDAYATTKIAKYLRSVFKEIAAFVPYEAASGGTVLCLSADSIVMDNISNLTPIDPQVSYKGQRVSVNSAQQALDDLNERFSKTQPEEIPSPYRELCHSFDPIILKEFSKMALDSIEVAFRLLNKHLKDEDKAAYIAIKLVKSSYTHNHIIDKKDAKEIGLNVVDDENSIKSLSIYKKWVASKLQETTTTHIIEYYIPEKKQNENGKEKTKKQ